MKTSSQKTSTKASPKPTAGSSEVFSPEGFGQSINLHQWMAGFIEGQRNAYEAEIELFKKRIVNAQVVSGKLFDWLTSKGITNSRGYIKIIDIYSFEAVVLIELESYLDASFRKQAFQKVSEIVSEANNSKFRIDFLLTDDSDNVNYELLQCNGFILTHSGN